MAADTSSSAAASTPVVDAAAAALASLSVEPIFPKSLAAAAIISGAAITYDMSIHPLARRADLDETGSHPGTAGSPSLPAWPAFGPGCAAGPGVSGYSPTPPPPHAWGP